MERDPQQRRGESISPAKSTMQERFNKLTYRFHPDQPSEGLEYVRIAAAAERTAIPAGASLEVAVWNTFKGKRDRYYDFLAEKTGTADLILLQEFRHDPALAAAHSDMFMHRDADMAVSFYTRPNREAPTGVCTVSCVRSAKTLFLLSRYYEPVTRTPKMAICTYYPIGRADCPPEESLLVLNSHGINFRLRRPFLDQMLQFESHLRHHAGPMMLVGDFNTWERGRVRILEAVARNLKLEHVKFPTGIKSVQGHELDRVYIRGGAATQQRVFNNSAASDHSLLAFRMALG